LIISSQDSSIICPRCNVYQAIIPIASYDPIKRLDLENLSSLKIAHLLNSVGITFIYGIAKLKSFHF